MSLIIAITLWKIPLTLKVLRINGRLRRDTRDDELLTELDKIKLERARKKAYMTIHQCIIYSFISLVLDIPLILISIIVAIICPWRIKGIYETIIKPDDRIPTKFFIRKLTSFKRIRELFTMIIILIADLLLLPGTLFLLVTIWRSGEVWSAFKHYIFLKNKELSTKFKELFSLHKIIFKNCALIVLDLLQLIQILLVMVLMLHFPSLCRRLYRVYKVMMAEKKVLADIAKAQEEKSTQGKTLMSMSYNILGTVLTYLDLKDILQFESVSKKALDVTKIPKVWRNLYEILYAKLAPLPKDLNNPDYKYYCIKGYQIELKAKKETLISEEMRDYLLGPRFIICEELFHSLLKIPHLLILPIKLLAFALYHIRGVFDYTHNLLKNLRLYEPMTLRSLNAVSIIPTTHLKELDKEEAKSFWKVQNTALGTILIAYDVVLCFVTYIVSRINYFIMEVTSGFVTIPIAPGTDLASQYPQYNMAPPPVHLNVYYTFQVLTFPIIAFNCLIWIIVPPIIWYKLSYSLVKILFGPCLVNIFFLGITVTVTANTFILSRYAVHYDPLDAVISFMRFTMNQGRSFISLLFNLFLQFLKQVIKPCIECIVKSLLSSGKLLFRSVKQLIKILFKIYFYPIIFFASIGKPLGLIWEAATLLIGLPWMFWPMIVPWYVGEKLLYIPAVILTAVLVVAGRYYLKDL